MHFLPEKLDDYIVSHSQEEPQLLKELTRETYQKILPNWSIQRVSWNWEPLLVIQRCALQKVYLRKVKYTP